MEYFKEVILKDGRRCVLRHGTEKDAKAVFDVFVLTHAQTDYLLTYPDETTDPSHEAEYLRAKTQSPDEIEIVAEVDGIIVGSGGIGHVGKREKVRHRADFGVSVDMAFWRLGIGRALTEACIECAKKAGYAQLELEAVAENEAALELYRSVGFVEYGRNPKGFRSRYSEWQELVLMRLELKGDEKMKELIAYCGLDCEKCDARIATVNGDDELRTKTAKLWSELNGVEITPEMINCVGCRVDGAKTPYCESLCPIRQCALSKGIAHCGVCADNKTCEKIGMIISNNEEARKNLSI